MSSGSEKYMPRPLNLAALALVGLVTMSATAEIITVCASGCDHTSINAAIAAASSGDVIQLSAETYFEGAVIDTDGKAIALQGATDTEGNVTSILDGGGKHVVLTCQSGETHATMFRNLVIQNGYAGGDSEKGGGMSNNGSSPNLTNCTFRSNSATYGGGMYNGNSGPTLTDCSFTGNTAVIYGGGMWNIVADPALTNCTFTGNSAFIGGGIGNGTIRGLILAECTFTGNSAHIGAGMFNLSSSPTLTDCTFTECCQVDPPRSIIDLGGNDYDSWCDECRADVNCQDNAVNSADLGYMLAAWGTTDPQCDLDGDGFVRAADLGLLLGYWGPCD